MEVDPLNITSDSERALNMTEVKKEAEEMLDFSDAEDGEILCLQEPSFQTNGQRPGAGQRNTGGIAWQGHSGVIARQGHPDAGQGHPGAEAGQAHLGTGQGHHEVEAIQGHPGVNARQRQTATGPGQGHPAAGPGQDRIEELDGRRPTNTQVRSMLNNATF